MNWKAGDPLKELKKAPISREQLRQYAEASGDDNPIHLDDEVARAQGLPSVIVHGMISMAFLADLVRANFPAQEYQLVSMRTRFRKVTYPDDQLTCGGQVKQLNPDGQLTVSVWAVSQNAERTSDGEAILRPL